MFAPGQKQKVSVFDGKAYIEAVLADKLSGNPSAGKATDNIEYDLVAEESDGSLYCRVWRPNTCGQVHFKSGSEIANQQHLVYDQACAHTVECLRKAAQALCQRQDSRQKSKEVGHSRNFFS